VLDVRLSHTFNSAQFHVVEQYDTRQTRVWTESHGGINILSGVEEIYCLVRGYQVRKVKNYT
jgi:hypothetical protein